MSNIEKAQTARKDSVLNKLTRYNGKVMSQKEFIETLVIIEHGIPFTYKEPKIKPMSRMAYFRATQQEQDRHEKRMQEAGDRICYAIRMLDSAFFIIPKIAFDYAEECYRNELVKEE